MVKPWRRKVRAFDRRRADPFRPIRAQGRLSPRELEVLELVAKGLTNLEIAKELLLSEETIKSHVRHTLAKLQAKSRAQAVSEGYLRGWLSIPSQDATSSPGERSRKPSGDEPKL